MKPLILMTLFIAFSTEMQAKKISKKSKKKAETSYVINITPENFDEKINQATKPVIIDVYAQWCTPCTLMKPVFEQLAQTFKDEAVFARLDINQKGNSDSRKL